MIPQDEIQKSIDAEWAKHLLKDPNAIKATFYEGAAATMRSFNIRITEGKFIVPK